MSSRKGADWYEEADQDKIAMLESCRRGFQVEVAKFLSAGVDIDEEDDDGVTALQIAAAKGHRRLVEFLLKKGAQIEKANYAGMTSFLHACREGHQDVVTLLANNGANIHAITGLGVSALALACAGRHIAVVRTLKGLSVAVNPQQSPKQHQVAPTPYMVAFFMMDIQICGFLKKNDAQVWNRIRGMDGLDVARMGELLAFPDMLIRLNFADNTLRAPQGEKDIREVIQSGQERVLDWMLRENKVAVQLKDGITPLMIAAISRHTNIAKLLLESGKGGTVDAQENVLGMTALMFAVVAGDSPMVHLLLKMGANPRILSTTREHFSALDLAHFSDIGRDSQIQLCEHWIRAGKGSKAVLDQIDRHHSEEGHQRRERDEEGRKGAMNTLRASAHSGKRLRKVIESIGKNLMGLAEEEQRSAVRDTSSGQSRFEMASDYAQLDSHCQFVLAEHILRGDARPPNLSRTSVDNLIVLARQTAISWTTKGHCLLPIPTGARLRSAFGGEEHLSDGLYSAAQRNALLELPAIRNSVLLRQRSEPVELGQRTPVTPRLNRTIQDQAQKSPSAISNSQPRTVRKAPHRYAYRHHRASSGGSHQSFQGQPATPDSPRTPTSPRPAMFTTNKKPPLIPQPLLTKELVQTKLREHGLEKQFRYFDAEEVDLCTFATFIEKDVREVLARQGQYEQNLCQRFMDCISEINRCTGCSELL